MSRIRTASFHAAKPRRRWRGAALAAAAALSAGAVVCWLNRDANVPVVDRVAIAASPTTGAVDWASLGNDLSPITGAASQVQLSPVSETLRQSGVSAGDVIGRIQQRQAMSRLFADAKDIERARSENALMAPSSSETAINRMGILSQRQKSDGRAFVQYNLRTLESRVEGDQFDIFLPGAGLTTKAVIEQVESVDGMLRWTGRILDFQEGGKFSVMHALQDNYAVGTFDTPLGNFSMEAKNGWGWVAPQSADFFLPPDGNDGLHVPASDTATVPVRR